MRPKSAVLLVLALGCGLIAALGINQVMSNRSDATTVARGETTPIFVALEKIGIGDVIKPEQVKLIEWEKDRVPEGAIAKLEELEDRRPWTPIFPGDPIVEEKLMGRGQGAGGIGELITPGMRVVAVRTNEEQGGAGLVKPGDRVDLSVHVRANPQEGIDRSITVTFLQNVKVVAVNSEYVRDKDGTQATVAKTISFEVTPEQVEIVTQATEMGTIRMSLRSPSDTNIVTTPGIDLSEMIKGKSHDTVPTTPKAPDNSLTDILSKMTPAAPQSAPMVEAPATPKPDFRMTVWKGDAKEDVEFINGKPVTPTAADSLGAGSPPIPDSTPTTDTDDSSADSDSDNQDSGDRNKDQ